MAFRLGPWKLAWPKRESAQDPYWDFFIHTPPTDPANTVIDMIRRAPQGNVFPVKADLHSPEITSGHVKGMARYLGADLVGIARLNHGSGDEYPFAVLCIVKADHDPRVAPGIGGQVPVQNGLFVTFVLSAWIRELGFRATAAPDDAAESLAEKAGLGKLNAHGRLETAEYGTKVHVADVIRTDLPLATDG